PYSERLDAHMYVHLKYPSRASDDFLNELTSLINNFENYVKKHDYTGPHGPIGFLKYGHKHNKLLQFVPVI
ncbi:MAG: hypothetical protein ACYSR9_11775, partial [Planctomycetota bacterium]